MATFIPSQDDFGQGVAVLTHPLEYLRGNVAGGYADADPHLIYDAGDGFARFEDGAATIALYRRLSTDAIRVKARWQHKRVSGTAGATRYTGLLLRARPAALTASATAGQTDYTSGLASAYLVEVSDNNSTVLVSIFRVVSAGKTLLGTAVVAAAEDTWHTIEARIQTNSSGNVEVVALYNGSPLSGMAPLTDSNPARVLTAGAVGFEGTSVNAAGEEVRTLFDYFQVVAIDGSETYLEDDFQRPDPVLTTAGGKVHASLLWEFGDAAQVSGAVGSTVAPGYVGNALAVQPGNPAAGFIGPWVDLYQRNPAGEDQAAHIRFRFDASAPGAQHEIGVVLKGSKSAAGTGTANFTGYVAFAKLKTNGLFSLNILRYSAGSATALATRDWIFVPDKWYRLELEGEVNGGGYDLTLRLATGGTLMVGVLTANDPTKLAGNGMQGIYGKAFYAGGSAGTILVDEWLATAKPAANASGAVLVYGSYEALDYAPEYLEELVKEWPAIAHEFDSGHVQTLGAMRQGLRRHRGTWLQTQSDAEAVRDFLLARAADNAPFELTTSLGVIRFRVAQSEIPFEQITTGAYRVGPVDLVEFIEPDSTP